MPIWHLHANTVYDSEGALPNGCADTLKKTTRLARLASHMLQQNQAQLTFFSHIQLIPDGLRACLR